MECTTRERFLLEVSSEKEDVDELGTIPWATAETLQRDILILSRELKGRSRAKRIACTSRATHKPPLWFGPCGATEGREKTYYQSLVNVKENAYGEFTTNESASSEARSMTRRETFAEVKENAWERWRRETPVVCYCPS